MGINTSLKVVRFVQFGMLRIFLGISLLFLEIWAQLSPEIAAKLDAAQGNWKLTGCTNQVQKNDITNTYPAQNCPDWLQTLEIKKINSDNWHFVFKTTEWTVIPDGEQRSYTFPNGSKVWQWCKLSPAKFDSIQRTLRNRPYHIFFLQNWYIHFVEGNVWFELYDYDKTKTAKLSSYYYGRA